MLTIKPGTYGVSEHVGIYLIDSEYPENKFMPKYDMNGDDVYCILAQLEWYIKNNIPVSIEGFRTDRDKYPNG